MDMANNNANQINKKEIKTEQNKTVQNKTLADKALISSTTRIMKKTKTNSVKKNQPTQAKEEYLKSKIKKSFLQISKPQ